MVFGINRKTVSDFKLSIYDSYSVLIAPGNVVPTNPGYIYTSGQVPLPATFQRSFGVVRPFEHLQAGFAPPADSNVGAVPNTIQGYLEPVTGTLVCRIVALSDGTLFGGLTSTSQFPSDGSFPIFITTHDSAWQIVSLVDARPASCGFG
jgi:hypothetical protein